MGIITGANLDPDRGRYITSPGRNEVANHDTVPHKVKPFAVYCVPG